MIIQKKVAAHVYTVELRFSGENLKPFDLSQRLGLQPSNEFNQLFSQRCTKIRSPYWAYNGQGEIGFQHEWESLQEGLEFLIKCLNSKKQEIIALRHLFDGAWLCGHFQSSFDGGPTLLPELLNEIASYKLPLCIDNYFSDNCDHLL